MPHASPPFASLVNDVTCPWHNEGGAEWGEGSGEGGGSLLRVENMNDRRCAKRHVKPVDALLAQMKCTILGADKNQVIALTL